MRKILVLQGAGANYFIRSSLCSAWKASGNVVYFWDKAGKSAFDVFQEFEPDIFLGDVWQLDRPIVKNLSKYKHVKSILYGDIWGDIEKEIDFEKYPVGRTTDEQKRLVESLIKGGADFKNIISNHGPDDIKVTHNKWKDNLGLNIHSVLVSADTTIYYPREKDNKYRAQCFYTGGAWGYKNRTINQYLSPLFYPNTKDWKIRIAGNGWNNVHSVGQMSSEEVAKHYTNSDIVPHMTEPHVSENIYQDLPLRYFEVPACKGFSVSCPCNSIRNIFDEDELVVADNPKDFFDKVVYYLNHPDETIPYRERAMKKVLTLHTGFDRAEQLFNMIDYDTTSIKEAKQKVITKNFS